MLGPRPEGVDRNRVDGADGYMRLESPSNSDMLASPDVPHESGHSPKVYPPSTPACGRRGMFGVGSTDMGPRTSAGTPWRSITHVIQ